jgi:hypothetical protein
MQLFSNDYSTFGLQKLLEVYSPAFLNEVGMYSGMQGLHEADLLYALISHASLPECDLARHCRGFCVTLGSTEIALRFTSSEADRMWSH